jgi:phosphoribosylformimino-5-aminoimidazole carboxamide ribotide isomerase
MTSTLQLLAAIDLLDGRVVRLVEGDFERVTTFGDDPVATAVRHQTAGAAWLHVVDLDGARTGTPRQLGTVRAIVERLAGSARVEIAGGLRTTAAVEDALGAGADRVVLGTAVLRDPALAAEVVARHGPDRLAIAIDVREGRAVGEGWRAGGIDAPPAPVIEQLVAVGVRTFEVTAIARDGTRSGPDLELYRDLVVPGREVVASGGIATLADLIALRDIGCSGAILGRALYEGYIDIATALTMLHG